jgi:tRNA (cytidine/uridine-2'-O-)-methyltransferase
VIAFEVMKMLNIVLVEPEIPQNCGNVARTCAATGARLHLIRPLGFDISEKAVRRAGLDYWHKVEVLDYENLEEFFAKNEIRQMWCLSTKAPRSYAEARYDDGCYLFFGKETKGLPESFLEEHRESCVRIPMGENIRSLNLSNTVAITVFEALRQLDFPNLLGYGKMRE